MENKQSENTIQDEHVRKFKEIVFTIFMYLSSLFLLGIYIFIRRRIGIPVILEEILAEKSLEQLMKDTIMIINIIMVILFFIVNIIMWVEKLNIPDRIEYCLSNLKRKKKIFIYPVVCFEILVLVFYFI